MIQEPNQITWMYTNLIDPANRVIWSATRFSQFFRRSWACCSSAGLTGMGAGRALTPPPLVLDLRAATPPRAAAG
jgi:hypothetical protein